MVLSILVFSVLAAAGGSNLVLLFSGLGGLSGLAALATVYVNYRNGTKKAQQDDKSVAIAEFEAAVPGLGDIIREWQGVVHQLQADLTYSKQEVAMLRAELAACRAELAELGGRS